MSHIRLRATTLTALTLAGAVLMAACGDMTAPETGAVEITVTADGQAESGVSVQLLESDGGTQVASGTTGADGTAAFSDVEVGSYQVEITVPSGYELSSGQNPQSVSVEADGTATASFGLSASGGGGSTTETVTLYDNYFQPDSAAITVGTTVKWVHQGQNGHTVTPDGHSEWAGQSLSSSGDEFSHTFNSAGTYQYYCSPHQSVGMTGQIVVEE